MKVGYKLFRNTNNGLRSLFIDNKRPLPEGVWLRAEDVPTKGYAHRPGWHVLLRPHAPHLSKKRRVMRRVEVKDIWHQETRPACQGGTWLTAGWIRIPKRKQ